MKCRYKYCKFGGEVDKKEAIKDKNCYYHKECYEEKINKTKIRDIYINKINNAVVAQQLNAVIANIIHKKHIDSRYLLFVVNYIAQHKKPINSPMGLHYYINDKEIKKQWQKSQHFKLQREINNSEVKTIQTEMVAYHFEDKYDWGNIFKQ